MSEPVLVALTGAPGSGKTTVAELLRQNGIPVLDADQMGKELMETDPELRERLQQTFGADIFGPDGRLRTAALAARIFGRTPQHRRARRLVEELVHPRVLEALAEHVQRLASEGAQLVVVEAALVFETGLDEAFDYVIVVDAQESKRRERLCQRGWSQEQIAAREAAQQSPSSKRLRADIVLANDGSFEELKQSVDFLAALLRTLPPRVPPSEQTEVLPRPDVSSASERHDAG
ncbi:MAG: dephospho-CoA kinase [Candidatus Kapabacteria bacterium]|nr:dephospho-CoA kinase [Candidatus Kapabacteria bacterium]MDW8224609.1 dephospho-CoA kinase [Bacteroidota bacterium]